MHYKLNLKNNKELNKPNLLKPEFSNIPPAINLDGSIREKQHPFDYGLTSRDAEIEYHNNLWKLKNAH